MQTHYPSWGGIQAQRHGIAFLTETATFERLLLLECDMDEAESGFLSMPIRTGAIKRYLELSLDQQGSTALHEILQRYLTGFTAEAIEELEIYWSSALHPATFQAPDVSQIRRFRNILGIHFRYVPGGSFLMGCDIGREEDTRPAHQVTIRKPLLVQETPVTVDQFNGFVRSTGYSTDAERLGRGQKFDSLGHEPVNGLNWRKPGFTQQGDHPVVMISWNDANAFLRWLNQAGEKVVYRLPTEAEWEYFCRAGTNQATYAGQHESEEWGFGNHTAFRSASLEPIAWYRANSWVGRNDGRKPIHCYPRDLPPTAGTHAVGGKVSNGFGLFDTLGNVGEWCEDFHSPTYYLHSPEYDPICSEDNGFREVRGGNWAVDEGPCSAHYRDGYKPMHGYDTIGLRIVAEP